MNQQPARSSSSISISSHEYRIHHPVLVGGLTLYVPQGNVRRGWVQQPRETNNCLRRVESSPDQRHRATTPRLKRSGPSVKPFFRHFYGPMATLSTEDE